MISKSDLKLNTNLIIYVYIYGTYGSITSLFFFCSQLGVYFKPRVHKCKMFVKIEAIFSVSKKEDADLCVWCYRRFSSKRNRLDAYSELLVKAF